MIRVLHGDCRDVLRELDADSIHACFTDPPYGLEFMGREWDAPWQMSSKSALFGKRAQDMPGFGVTRNPTCQTCGGRFRGAKQCHCDNPAWDEAIETTRARQMAGYQAWCVEWAHELRRVLKPGAYLMACCGTRTYHRLACAIEDAGFEIRDACAWLYGSGFPKSRDASKAIDQELGAERKGRFEGAFDRRAGPTGNKRCDRCGQWLISSNPCTCPRVGEEPATPQAAQWQGFGTALKPAQELIVLARKPMTGNLAQNLMRNGTGAINVDACRVAYEEDCRLLKGGSYGGNRAGASGNSIFGTGGSEVSYETEPPDAGRWPANVQHDGSEEVLQHFPASDGAQSAVTGNEPSSKTNAVYGEFNGRPATTPRLDTGSSARFFFSPKADAEARIYECTICQRKINAGDRARHKHGQKNNAHIKSHPTVKPIDLIRYYLRLIVPPGGTVLDPFAGTGTTGEAAMLEGFDCLMIERDGGTVADIQHRIGRWSGQDAPLFAEAAE